MAGMSDAERRLRVLEARNMIVRGAHDDGPVLSERGELGRLTAIAMESWDSIRGSATAAKSAYILMRVTSVALEVLQDRAVSEAERQEVHALFSLTRPRYRVYGWEEGAKHPDAAALYEQLQREGHL